MDVRVEWRSFCLWPQAVWSASGIGNPNGLLQCGAGPLKKVLHPGAFLGKLGCSGALRLADCWRRPHRFDRLGAATNAQILALEAQVDGPVEALLYLHLGFAHPYSHIPAIDLIELSLVAHGVVVDDLPLFYVAQDRRQIVLLA